MQSGSAAGESARGGMRGAEEGVFVAGLDVSWERSISSGEETGVRSGDDGGGVVRCSEVGEVAR